MMLSERFYFGIKGFSGSVGTSMIKIVKDSLIMVHYSFGDRIKLIPSMYKLAELHRKTGDLAKAKYYDDMAKELLARLWDKKIEQENRKHYSSEE